MTSFSMLSETIRALFALWALLLGLFCIINAVLAFGKKKYILGSSAILLFLPIYLFWQIIFDLSLSNKGNVMNDISKTFVDIYWLYWLLIFITFTLLNIVLFIINLHYEKNHITINSIKIYLDKIDCGVCYYKPNGRVLFANTCINQICSSLMGSPLLNGNQFREVVGNEILSIGDEKWRFSYREIVLKNERIHEITASNVTNEYNKTKMLEKDKVELSRIKKELQEYNLSIEEMVRHQEILQAKINIHDEMNRLMLSSVATENDNISQLDNIFALWQENALLLSNEVETKKEETMIDHINEMAKSLKINLIWKGDSPAILLEKERNIFFQTAQEAIANAAKHAKATEMTISIENIKNAINCYFVNNGIIPQKPIVFTGGLSNLESLIKKQDASITTENKKDLFTLTLIFSHKNNPNG